MTSCPHGAFVPVLSYLLFLGLEGLYPQPVPCPGSICWVQTSTCDARLRLRVSSRLGLSTAAPFWPCPLPWAAFVCLPSLWPGPPLCRQELSLTQLRPQRSATLTAEVERGLGMRVEREGQVGGWCRARERQHKVFSGHTCSAQWLWSLKANAALTNWLDSSSLASLASLTKGR